MVKIKKQFLVTALVTVGTLVQSSTVFAYNPDPPVAAGSYNVVDVATWDQMGYNGTVPKSKTDMGSFHWSSGCMTMSYATFMRKSGQRDKNWGPNDAFDELNKLGDYGGGQFPMQRYNNGAKWGDWTLESYEQGGFAGLKKAWDDGYALVCMVSMPGGGRHVFSIDYIDGDKVAMLDTGRKGVFLDDPGQWGKGSILGYYKLKSPDGTKGKDLPRLNDVRDGSNSKTTKKSDSKTSSKSTSGDSDGGLAKEEDLVGMSGRDYLYEHQNKIEQASPLWGEEQQHLSSIAESVKSQKVDFLQVLRYSVAFIGIIFAVYGLLIIIAYVFDRTNVFVELSLLSILTMGRYMYSYETDVKNIGNKKLLNTGGVIRLAILSEVIAYALYSGLIYSILRYIISVINNLVFS